MTSYESPWSVSSPQRSHMVKISPQSIDLVPLIRHKVALSCEEEEEEEEEEEPGARRDISVCRCVWPALSITSLLRIPFVFPPERRQKTYLIWNSEGQRVPAVCDLEVLPVPFDPRKLSSCSSCSLVCEGWHLLLFKLTGNICIHKENMHTFPFLMALFLQQPERPGANCPEEPKLVDITQKTLGYYSCHCTKALWPYVWSTWHFACFSA